MNKSLVTSLISLFVVIFFTLTMIVVFTGSAGVEFKRNPLVGDADTSALIAAKLKAEKDRAREIDNSGFTEDVPMEETGPQGGGAKVVMWISIPGLRTDYIEKSEAPMLQEMVSDGDDTDKLIPNFPNLTAPAHATLATGTTADVHGILMDKMRNDDGTIVDSDGTQLVAEPIWTTATRQGVRVLVHDWPLSFKQPAEHAAAISNASYDPDLTDQQRLDALYDAWSSDTGEEKIRLVMCRLDGIQNGAMENGPRQDETYAVVGETDKALKGFFDKVKENWATLGPENGELVVLVTTDHGMILRDKNVNLTKLLGDEAENVDIIAHDAIAQLFFKNMPESDGERKLFEDKFDKSLGSRTYFRTLKQEDLPSNWKFVHEGRTGDRVLVLKSGFSFSDFEAEEPVFAPVDGDTKYGCFGFPVEVAFRMTGQAIVWGYPESPSASLGEMDQTGFHAAVCEILGIKPSDNAAGASFNVR